MEVRWRWVQVLFVGNALEMSTKESWAISGRNVLDSNVGYPLEISTSFSLLKRLWIQKGSSVDAHS